MNTQKNITTEQGNQYFYSDTLRYFLYIPNALKSGRKKDISSTFGMDDYYMRKLNFLQEYHFFDIFVFAV